MTPEAETLRNGALPTKVTFSIVHTVAVLR